MEKNVWYLYMQVVVIFFFNDSLLLQDIDFAHNYKIENLVIWVVFAKEGNGLDQGKRLFK